MASSAPACCICWAIAQAMLRLLATPNTTTVRPCNPFDTVCFLPSQTIEDTSEDAEMSRRTESGLPGGGDYFSSPALDFCFPWIVPWEYTRLHSQLPNRARLRQPCADGHCKTDRAAGVGFRFSAASRNFAG